MSRLSFRPRPLNIHKKLVILKDFEDEDDDAGYRPMAATRNYHLVRVLPEKNCSKRSADVIPIPQFSVVDTYEHDYVASFVQPASYLRGRGRVELGEFVEYDLDDEDEDWLEKFNDGNIVLAAEKFETILFKLEVLDLRTRERAGVAAPTFGTPVPVLLDPGAAAEALEAQSVSSSVFQSVYNYWKTKRVQWQKPIFRQLQPPPPASDINPYNVFRPRQKVHRLHTRRMQRRENSIFSFEKLREVRRNLEHAKILFKELIKREEKKREIIESEVNLQRVQIKYKDEAQLVEDVPVSSDTSSDSYSYEYDSSTDDDFMDLDDTPKGHLQAQSATVRHFPITASRLVTVPVGPVKEVFEGRPQSNGLFRRTDPEPVMLFTKRLDREKLAAAGITWPHVSPIENGSVTPAYRFCGRMGRGGRIIFDRMNPLLRAPN